MSDTASRLSAFESRFDSVTQSLSSAIQMLHDQSTQQAQAQKDQFALMSQLISMVMPQSAVTLSHTTNTTPSNLSQTPTAAPNDTRAATVGTQQNASSDQANQPIQEYKTSGSPSGGTAGLG
jgi:hypothetical protein